MGVGTGLIKRLQSVLHEADIKTSNSTLKMEYRACKEKHDVLLTQTSEVIQQAVTTGKVGA